MALIKESISNKSSSIEFFSGLSKLLVFSSPNKIEIFDLNPDQYFEYYHDLEMPNLPVGVWEATGSLFMKTPIICGETREEGQEVSCKCLAYHFGA